MIWSRVFRRSRWDAERTAELDEYVAAETADNIVRGMPADEARQAAIRKLGNPARIREEIYTMNTVPILDTFWQNLRFAIRVLSKSPGFTAIAVLSLALGIGANTAAFSVVRAVLLRALPYPESERLMHLGRVETLSEVSVPEVEFWKQHSASFIAVAGHQGVSTRLLTAGPQTEWVETMRVTGDFFHTLGISLAAGREFQPEETRRGGARAVVLTEALSRRLFGSPANAAGHVVTIDNAAFTVAGVLPAAFWFHQTVDAFVPLQPSGSVGDEGANTEMLARLKPGVSLGQARAEMAALSENYRRQLPTADKYLGLTTTPYRDWLVLDIRTKLLLLFGAVALLLLIALVNLASLLLARLAARRKEIAMRMAIGSSRGRLLGQFLTENLLLTFGGALAGILAARASLDLLVKLIPFHLPAAGSIRIDGAVLGLTVAVAFAAGLAFSLAPIVTANRLDLQDAMKSGERAGMSGARQRGRSVLVVSEVALSVTLLVSAGLLIQSLYRLHHERLGFNPHGVMTFSTPNTAQHRRTAAAQRAFEAALAERLRTMPGVRSVTNVNVLPLTDQNNFPAQREGHPDQSIGGMEIRIVGPSYFEIMAIPMARGRSFGAHDDAAATPVMLVNETVARAWWKDGSPLGDYVKVGKFKGRVIGNDPPREVVGVVADTKSVHLKAQPRPTVYLPIAQAGWYDPGLDWVVRGEFSPMFAADLRRIVTEIDPKQRLDHVRTMDAIVDATKADSRFDAYLFGILAAIALALTAIGVYGLLSFSVARRTHEIGTRMALGASRAAVLKMVLKQGLSLIAAGLALGLAGAAAVSRSLQGLLFGVRPTDPSSFVAVAAVLLVTGFLASYFPARRATEVDPITALRSE